MYDDEDVALAHYRALRELSYTHDEAVATLRRGYHLPEQFYADLAPLTTAERAQFHNGMRERLR